MVIRSRSQRSGSKEPRILLRGVSLYIAIALTILCYVETPYVTHAFAAITTTPTSLIAQMPFYVFSDDVTVTNVFLASSSSCSSASTVAAAQSLSSPYYNTLFQLPTQSLLTLYVCQSVGGLPLSTLSFTQMTYTPQYFFRGTAQTISFSSNLPINSRVFVKEYSDCSSGTTAIDQLTSPSNTITATTTNTFFYFMCVTALSEATGQSVTVNIGQVVSTDAATFTPPTVLRYDTSTTFEIGGSSPPSTRVMLAPNTDCTTVLQGPVTASGQFSKSVNMSVQLTRGSYAFCVENPLSSGIYVPAGTLAVQAYQISPITIFANTAVTFTLTGDTPSNPTLGWSSTPCSSPTWTRGPSTISSTTFTETFVTTGTIYSCVYKPNSMPVLFVRAALHSIVTAYTATINRGTDVVRGLSVSITVSPNAVTFVSLHMGVGCSGTTFASGNSSNFVFSATVPLALTFPGAMTVCVRTIDGSATYAVRTATIRSFDLRYGVIITGTATQFTIDSALAIGAVSTPAYRFVVGNMDCSGSDAGFGIQNPTPTNVSFTFNTAGIYTFCARSFDVNFVPITAVQAFVAPTASPNATLTGIDTVITVSNVPTGLTATIGPNCSNVDQTQVQSATLGSIVFTINYATAGSKVVCVFLPSANGTTAPYIAANISVSGITVSPTRAFQSQRTRFNVLATVASLVAGANAFITTSGSAGCTAPPADLAAVVFNNGNPYVVLTVPSTVMTIGICVGGHSAANGIYLYAGAVAVIAGLLTTYDPSPPAVSIPFNMAFSGSFTPTSYAIATEANGCSAPVTSGSLVGGATPSPVTINTAGIYVVCVEADAGTFLVAATLNLQALIASPSTYVRLLSTTLTSSPSIGSSVFLTAATDCSGPRYLASVASPLAAPAGNYVMCVIVGSTIAIAQNTVSVIAAYSLTLPSNIRSYIPFTIGISGGDVAAAGFAAGFFIPVTSPTTGATLTCSNTSLTSTEIVARFNSTSPTQIVTSIPAREDTPYYLCARTRDNSAAVRLATVTPASYIYPSVVIKGVTTTITSGGMASGYAIIAANADCSGTRLAGPIQVVNYLMDGVVVLASVTATSGYYCESADNGAIVPYTYRATVALVPYITLPPSPTTYPSSEPVGFDDRTLPPSYSLYACCVSIDGFSSLRQPQQKLHRRNFWDYRHGIHSGGE